MEPNVVSTVQGSALLRPGAEDQKAMADHMDRVFSHQVAMSVARSMLSQGLISEKEYNDIDTILTKKHGLSSSSIFR